MAKKTTNERTEKQTTSVKKKEEPKKTLSVENKSVKKESVIISSPFWNIWDTGKTYKVRILIAGASKKDISIVTKGNHLIVSSEKDNKKETKEKNYIVQQYSYSSWSKSISLPEKLNDKDIKINYRDGVLRIEIQKETK